ncbi:OmpA family protein [Bacteroidales bacterium AH-315-I05]|nr:OmpA family protein [Bacteroidales bacterium AH-315-I05]
MRVKILPVILFFCIAANAQISVYNVEFTTKNFLDKKGMQQAVQEILKGDEYYKNRVYTMALSHYIKANEFNANNAKLNRSIGICYLNMSKPIFAITYLGRAIELATTTDPDLIFFLGKAYQQNYEWDRAIYQYNKNLNQLEMYGSQMKDYEENRQFVLKKINECNYGKELEKKPVEIKIINMGEKINSEQDDYCPLISADESIMLFTSRRAGTTGGNLLPGTDFYFEDIYYSEKNGEGWTEAKNIGQPVNTNTNDATVGLSPDGQRMFVFKDDNNNGNVYECVLEGNTWSKPKKLNNNINSKHNEPSACYTYDGNTIIFVSDMPGGKGKKDIYWAKKDKKGQWDDPENLGPTINTKYNEDGIYMHPDGKTLYFSSEGHQGIGGYDIFKSEYNAESKSWSKPENLGFPLNTPLNDIFFVLSANGQHGYYTSVQPGGMGRKDIYLVQYEEEWVDHSEQSQKIQQYYDSVQHKITNLNSALDQATGLSGILLVSEIDEKQNLKNVAIAESNLVSKKRELSDIKREMSELSVHLDSLDMYAAYHEKSAILPGTHEFEESQQIHKMHSLYASISTNVDSLEAVLKKKTVDLMTVKGPPTKNYKKISSELEKAKTLTNKIIESFGNEMINREKKLFDLKNTLEESSDIVFFMMNDQMEDADKIRYIDSLEQRVLNKQDELLMIKKEMTALQKSIESLETESSKLSKKESKQIGFEQIRQISNTIASKVMSLDALLTSTQRISEINSKNNVIHPRDLSPQYQVVKMALNASNTHARSLLEEKSGRQILKKKDQPHLVLLKGIITNDENPNVPMAAKIEIVDNAKDKVITEFYSNSATGKYLVTLPAGKNYGILVTAEGYLFYSENIRLDAKAQFEEREKNIMLEKIEIGKSVVLNNIFFEFGNYELTSESQHELESIHNIMQENPTIKVEISGHTDNKSSNSFNLKLSENRAKAVVDFLITKGISEERLTYIGHGETKPIASNETEDGRQSNRRTEFQILGK